MPLTTDGMTEIRITSPADQITVLTTGSDSSAAAATPAPWTSPATTSASRPSKRPTTRHSTSGNSTSVVALISTINR